MKKLIIPVSIINLFLIGCFPFGPDNDNLMVEFILTDTLGNTTTTFS